MTFNNDHRVSNHSIGHILFKIGVKLLIKGIQHGMAKHRAEKEAARQAAASTQSKGGRT